ncbi:MAG: hypothetical protein IKN53_06900 [Oscillibacter sp.]|nr:hypothetical protein [Oscillibacter sp.]
MADFEIAYTVNAGLYFRLDDAGLLVDALHRGLDVGFSDTAPLLLRDLRAHEGIFRREIDLVFTHSHPDHFDPVLTDEFSRLYPASRVAVAGEFAVGLREEPLAADVQRLRFGAFEVLAVTTEHQGVDYQIVPHRALILSAAGRRYLICADALLTPALAARFRSLAPSGFDAVFANVYHVGEKTERAALAAIPARQIFLYHLPFPQDDPCDFHHVAASVTASLPADFPPVRVLWPQAERTVTPIEGAPL